MEMKNKIEELEKLTKQIETETDFEAVVELFGNAAVMIKEAISGTAKAKGKLLEIVRDLDEYIEKELKLSEEN